MMYEKSERNKRVQGSLWTYNVQSMHISLNMTVICPLRCHYLYRVY